MVGVRSLPDITEMKLSNIYFYDYNERFRERRTEKLSQGSCILKAKSSTDLSAFQRDTRFYVFIFSD